MRGRSRGRVRDVVVDHALDELLEDQSMYVAAGYLASTTLGTVSTVIAGVITVITFNVGTGLPDDANFFILVGQAT